MRREGIFYVRYNGRLHDSGQDPTRVALLGRQLPLVGGQFKCAARRRKPHEIQCQRGIVHPRFGTLTN